MHYVYCITKRERDHQKDRGNFTREDQQKPKGGSRGRNNENETAKQQTGRSGRHDPSANASEGGKGDRSGGKRVSDKEIWKKGGSRDEKYEETKPRGDRGGNKEYEPPPRRQKGKR